MRSKRRAAVLGAILAGALAVPASSPAKLPRAASPQAVAVLACLEYRELIGRDAFREAFGNVRGCVAMVVPAER